LSAAEFLPDLGGLERAFEVAYVDPRGTGATPRPVDSRAYALDDYVDDLAELIDEPSFVLGFSHGGLVAQRFAARHPGKVSGLVLASTAARFSSDVDAALARKVEASKGEPWLPDALDALSQEQAGDYKGDAELARVLARELPLFFHKFDDRAARWVNLIVGHPCNADALRHFNEAEFMSIDLRAELPKISALTIVVSGESDFVCPPEAGQELQDGIEGSALTIIPRSGHMTYVEQPEAFYEAVVAVLK
jgi:pimeloyl-ACP methyl ester carboxylesterase